jgi:ubiquitin-conjugating enzyme E2 H
MNVNNKRKERDLMKLIMSNYEVKLTEEGNQNDFYVKFVGPKESPYEGVKIFVINIKFVFF